ncbi:MAG TPA: glycosyltransferase family 9 protein [Tepidisphaeraceae bacterium]|nr:glycosyltransferase family 9 protein [Tepidisphaeraceae bacterium]
MIRRNVLIFHTAALGDFILSWPLAAALGRLHPQSRIIYVTHHSKGALAASVLRLESCDCESGWGALHGAGSELAPKSQKLLADAHSIYTFTASRDEGWFARCLAFNPDASITSLATRPPRDYRAHVTDFLVEQLGHVPAARSAMQQILLSIAGKGLGTRKPTESGPVLIHPGSGWRDKCWPAERFAALAEKIAASGRAVRIVLGEVETERFSAVDIRRLESAAAVIRPASYINLLTEITAARAFIGNDSGPTHLAAIVGVPTLALFGPTDPAVWRPIGPRIVVERHEPLNELTTDRVADLAQKLLD